MHALNKHNDLLPDPRLTLLDGAILCLAKSFYETDQKLFMSNKELGKLFLSDPGTIQRSIDRLSTAGLISKEKEYIASKQRRYITYKPEAVQNLLNLM
jgi:DNA-binding MarR family transcriptional regulator